MSWKALTGIIWTTRSSLYLPRFDEANCTWHLIVENVEWLEVLSKDKLSANTSWDFAYFCDQSRLKAQSPQIETKLQSWHFWIFPYFPHVSRFRANHAFQCLAVHTSQASPCCLPYRSWKDASCRPKDSQSCLSKGSSEGSWNMICTQRLVVQHVFNHVWLDLVHPTLNVLSLSLV